MDYIKLFKEWKTNKENIAELKEYTIKNKQELISIYWLDFVIDIVVAEYHDIINKYKLWILKNYYITKQ